jgi:hypothetical protein
MTRAGEKWNPALAATYLDARQEAGFAWPRAAPPSLTAVLALTS